MIAFGKTTHAGTSWLHRLIERWAWPYYECEDCIGVGCGHAYPCYCAYHGASSPGEGPHDWHLFWRWVWEHRG